MNAKHVSYFLFMIIASILLYEGIIKVLDNDSYAMEIFFMPFIPNSFISLIKYIIPSIEILLALLLFVPAIRININYGIYLFTFVTMIYGILTVTVFKNYSYLCTPEGGCTLQYSFYAKHLTLYAVCCGLSVLNVFVNKTDNKLNVNAT